MGVSGNLGSISCVLNMDPTIFGTRLGSPILGNSQIHVYMIGSIGGKYS